MTSRSGRTERHPHADFPGALLDEVRQHAEQARQRQRQGQARRGRPSTRTRAAASRSPSWSATASSPPASMVGSIALNRFEKRLPCQFGIAVDARDERGPGHRGTRRHVDDGLVEGCDPEPCDVPDDPDHRERSRLEERLLLRAGRSGGQVVVTRVPDLGSGSRRTTWPSASAFGHSARAVASDTTATGEIRRTLVRRERPPPHDRDIEHAEVLRRDELVGDRCLCAGAALREAPPRARGRATPATMRPPRPPTVRPSPPARSPCGSARSRSRR